MFSTVPKTQKMVSLSLSLPPSTNIPRGTKWDREASRCLLDTLEARELAWCGVDDMEVYQKMLVSRHPQLSNHHQHSHQSSVIRHHIQRRLQRMNTHITYQQKSKNHQKCHGSDYPELALFLVTLVSSSIWPSMPHSQLCLALEGLPPPKLN